jgi:hypothetical protein
MSDLSIVAIVIAFVFVYSLVGILVTYINNFIVAILKLRAIHLREGLIDLISDEDLRRRVMGHPLVGLIKREDETPVITAQSVPTNTLDEADIIRDSDKTVNVDITYIKPETFVTALKSVLITESEKLLYGKIQELLDSMPNSVEKSLVRETVNDLRQSFTEAGFQELMARIDNWTATIPNPALRQALDDALSDIDHAVNVLRYNDGDLVVMMQGIEKIKSQKMRGTLKSLLTTAHKAEDAEKRIMDWFDEGMGRATEKFQNNLKRIAFGVSAVLVIAFNIDTLHIGRVLWEDSGLRQAVVAQAIEFQQPDQTGSDSISDSAQDIVASVQKLYDLQVPIGWQWTPITDEMVEQSRVLGLSDPYQNSRNFWNGVNSPNPYLWWVFKASGLLVTIIAAAQGSSFWFDLLRKLVSPARQS